MKLSTDKALLCFTFVDEIQDDKLLAEYQSMLPADELDKLGKFRFATHKKRYLVGRALLRTTLSKCVGIGPDLITFSRESHGRPFLMQYQQNNNVQFNLSYTDGLVAVALISGKQVGLDIENTSRQIDCLDIARNYFAQKEYCELKLLSGPPRRIRFFEFWTQKEAYMKARGLGLHLALDDVNFASSDNTTGPHLILMKDGRYWQFKLLNPSVTHKAAVCIGAASTSKIRIEYKKAVPLVREDAFVMPME
ncbi:MAG: 4'-phosphopantetheinyl transferase superfamily protein [Desulfofustis sp.]|nr:4'-phosphopantetheinyl transferase superfamily protein [Desulfofustis sp.]